jgi:hypothetical protein
MCNEDRRGTTSESIQNLRQPMPMGRKIKLVLRNSLTKLNTRSSCCGNYGEPGC